jgi:hypothetical protein
MLYYVNTDTLYHDCQLLKAYANRNTIDLIVVDDFQESWVYGCPCIEVNFPDILLLKKDRRYWKQFSGAQGRYHRIAYLENSRGDRVDIIPPMPYRVETWGFNYVSIRAEIFRFAPPISSLTFFKLMGFEHRAVYTARSTNP